MDLTRRDLIRIGAGTGAALAFGWRPAFALRQDELIHHTIPSSGERVPAIGIGGRDYRGPGEELPNFEDTLRVFAELGGKVIDTSPNYGNSETVMGDIMREQGTTDDIFIATKVDRETVEEGRERMAGSFDRLHTDVIDLMQVHNLRGAGEMLPVLREMKAAGRIRYLGITTSFERQYDGFYEVMRDEELDFIQVDYALDNRTAAERILPLAMDRGMAVLINLPFGRGRLFRLVGERALPEWAAEIGAETWAQVFLKYVISHPAVTVAIPGTTKPHHARDNLGAARGLLPNEAMRRMMERFVDALGD